MLCPCVRAGAVGFHGELRIPGACRGVVPKHAAGKNQASFCAQQRGEEIKRLRRWVLCVILWQGKALG